MKQESITGGVLGLALGDAFGAPYEGGPVERLLWRVLGWTGGRRRFTDDTQMTLDVIESLLAKGAMDPTDLSLRFAGSYRWSRGYGPGAARILKRIRKGMPWDQANCSVYPEGSFGNGGAMRSPVIGLFFFSRGEAAVVAAAQEAAVVTHAHPLAKEGAVLVALATAFAAEGMAGVGLLERLKPHAASDLFQGQIQTATDWLEGNREVSPREIATTFGNGIAATASCLTALYLALGSQEKSFEEMVDLGIRIGGDVDTICAMAGAVWGAGHGLDALPRAWLQQLEQSERLQERAAALAQAISRMETPQ